jgi:rhamnose utilization protein RhaD (predicted bifunctional aldolase and dehydrogenase)
VARRASEETTTVERDLGELAALSARIGGDPALVQGAGGNTSIKRGDTLWVKASGTWLRDAAREPVFVPISLREARALCAGGADDAAWKTLRRLDDSPLAPSIETPLHALLDADVVVHVHSIRTLAWAVRTDAAARLAERLEGLDWALVPYARPGAPLAEAVRTVVAGGRGGRVLVLANHGLVLGGASVSEVDALLEDVEARLAAGLPGSSGPPAGAAPPAAPAPPGYVWSADPWLAWLAHDAGRLALAEGGSLYPDHVVFLGPRVTVVDRVEDAGAHPEAKLLLVRGAGALVRDDLTPGAEALVHCLGRLLARLRPDDPVRYLSADDEAELLGWDAEAYRAHLDRMRRDASA